MKSLVMFLAMMMVSTIGFAQVNHGLKGPAAKNYKFYMDKNKPEPTEVVASTKDPLQGPARKNAKVIETIDVSATSKVATSSERPVLIGPKAKSTKPGKYYQPKSVEKQQKDTPDTPAKNDEPVTINSTQ